MVKIPPPPADDGVDRSTYYPLRVDIAPDGLSTSARVRFGYAENGAVDAFRCTSRREACVTDTLTAPFAYESSDAPLAPQPCSTGCTLAVPAIPGRVLYYRVERLDAAGQLLTAEPVQVFVAP
jgi:hypothetical protein